MLSNQSLALPFAFLFFVSAVLAQSAADFDLYPVNARPCLYSASNQTTCDTSSVAAYNACVCRNGDGFLDNSALCLNKDDPDDLKAVYNTLTTNCQESGNPVWYTEEQWLLAASAGSDSSATGTAASTATAAAETGSSASSASASSSTPANDDDSDVPPPEDGHKISTTGIIGLAVGIPVFLALLGLIFLLYRRWRTKAPYVPLDPAQNQSSNGQDGATAYQGYHQSPAPAYSVSTFANSPVVGAKTSPDSPMWTESPMHDSSARYFMQGQHNVAGSPGGSAYSTYVPPGSSPSTYGPASATSAYGPPPFYSQQEPIELQANEVSRTRHELPGSGFPAAEMKG